MTIRPFIAVLGMTLAVMTLAAQASDRAPLKLDPRYFGQLGAGIPQAYHEDVDDLLGKGNLEHVWPYRSGRVRDIADATGLLDFMTASDDRYGCTGALISDRLLLTAAHCVETTGAGRATQILFFLGYERVIDRDRISPLAAKPRPLEHDIDLDYALLELYAPAPERKPVSGVVRDAVAGEGLTVLAHPKASPLLLAQKNCLPDGERPLQGDYLNHHCHTESGSSGALVYSRDGRFIVGLHVEGDIGVNRAVRMAALMEASPTLRGLFSDAPEAITPPPPPPPEPKVVMACPPAATLPEGLTCKVGPGGELEWARVALLEPDPEPYQPPPVYTPPVAPFGISAEKWTSGAPGEPGSSFRDEAGAPEMVVIPAGNFLMGSPETEAGRESDEGPQRRIWIGRPFAMARTEVTVGQWRQFVAETGHSGSADCWRHDGNGWINQDDLSWRDPGYKQTDDHPVVCVSWEDTKTYISWLNQRTEGAPYRLPSEAEWEYAARARTLTVRYWGDDKSLTRACAYANLGDQAATREYKKISATSTGFPCDDGFAATAPVGRFGHNGFGLSDMMGNVWEWAEDCWEADLKGVPTDASSYVRKDCKTRAARGGGMDSLPKHIRSAARDRSSPHARLTAYGFRVARTLSP